MSDEWNDVFYKLVNSLGENFDRFLTKEFIETYGYKAGYQGFDVQKFRVHFRNRCMKLTNKHLIWLSHGKTIAASGDDNFNTLLAYLICMFFGGNNIKAIADALPEEGKRHWTTLTTMLDIKDGEAKDSTTVTLARIAAAFPVQTVLMVKQPHLYRKLINTVNMADVGIEQDSAGTRAIVHPMAGSLLTDEMKQNGWAFITLLCALRRSKITGGSSRDKVDYARLWNVQKAILGWKAVDDDVKREFWENLKVKEDVSDDIIKACKKVVREQVPTDLFQDILKYSGCHA